MPNVLVLAAGGLIGTAVSSAFRRAGFRVFGLIRTESHAQYLLANEVIPVIGDISEPETYIEVIKKCSVVVDASGTSEVFVDAMIRLNAEEEVAAYRKLFITTSGTLNVGGYKEGYIVEDAIRPTPPDFLKGRVPLFDKVLKNGGTIVEPAGVYGGSGRHTMLNGFAKSQSERLFNIAPDATLALYGPPRESAWVHVDDLAMVYVLVVAKNVRGERWPVQVENLENHAVTIACAKAAGWRGKIEYEEDVSKADDQLVRMIAGLSIRGNFRRLADRLGWDPKHRLMEDLDIYYATWKATRPKEGLLN